MFEQLEKYKDGLSKAQYDKISQYLKHIETSYTRIRAIRDKMVVTTSLLQSRFSIGKILNRIQEIRELIPDDSERREITSTITKSTESLLSHTRACLNPLSSSVNNDFILPAILDPNIFQIVSYDD
jgi:hypothetical protein